MIYFVLSLILSYILSDLIKIIIIDISESTKTKKKLWDTFYLI